MAIKDIQKVIEERAAKKLRSDIIALKTTIISNPLSRNANGTDDDVILILKSKGLTASLHDIVNGGSWYEAMFKSWLPRYIEQETQAFVETVDRLDNEMSDLRYQVDNIQQ